MSAPRSAPEFGKLSTAAQTLAGIFGPGGRVLGRHARAACSHAARCYGTALARHLGWRRFGAACLVVGVRGELAEAGQSLGVAELVAAVTEQGQGLLVAAAAAG